MPRPRTSPPSPPSPTGRMRSRSWIFYQAMSDQATPVVFLIHGGGWLNGDKDGCNHQRPYLDAGISVVSINYRLIPDAGEDGLVPPVQGPLLDAARALHFVRSKAAKWNFDKQRIGATGSSAGSCSAPWLAFHPDMADAKSSDPVARESTRLCAWPWRGRRLRWIRRCGHGFPTTTTARRRLDSKGTHRLPTPSSSPNRRRSCRASRSTRRMRCSRRMIRRCISSTTRPRPWGGRRKARRAPRISASVCSSSAGASVWRASWCIPARRR